MAMPTFQDMMLPVLKFLGDDLEHGNDEIISYLVNQYRLTPEEVNELLPSGKQSRFANRVGWAKSYLVQAGLIENKSRAHYQITSQGMQVLQTSPTRIDMQFLRRFPQYIEWRKRSRQASGVEQESIIDDDTVQQTPEELIENASFSLSRELIRSVLVRVKSSSPSFFERLVVDLLISMGYGGSRQDAGQAVGRSGDGGIDGIINEDRLGLDVIYIQAKRWESSVGRPEIQQFIGALEERRARKGVFITTSQFTKEARGAVERTEKKIILIDGEQLAQLMIEYGVGVAEKATYVVKRVDEDYFTDE